MHPPRNLFPRGTYFALVIAFAAGVLCAVAAGVRAESQPPVDHALVERLVRAEESQVKALEALTRAAERCKR